MMHVESDRSSQTAVIIGASSGIGEALARQLNREGWRLCLMARRMHRLEALRQSLAPQTVVHGVDVTHLDAPAIIERVLVQIGGADLVIISAGTGHNNRDLREDLDVDTVTVNVLGFMKVAQAVLRHFVKRGRGHLVGISSVAALRGNRIAAAYAASKAFQSVYLDGLRDLAGHSGLPIVVTEVQPGFVDTAMMKTERSMGTIARFLLVVSPDVAARQIMKAVQRRAKHVYVPWRYGLIAFVAKLLPRPG
jgi:short-subunit dehydrogenase